MFPYNKPYYPNVGATGPVSPPTPQVVKTQPTAFIADSSGVTVFHKGKSFTVAKSHVNYEKIVDALRNKRYDQLEALMDVAKAINTFAHGRVTVANGEVKFDGEPLHNVMADRLLDMMRGGFDVKPLANFMTNLMSNPSRTAVDELYLFLESGKLPITEDGHFLAYKKVKSNFFDIYSGKFDHSPGKTLEMPRNKVDDKRDNTCSYGFHFCTISYLPQYSSDYNNRVVIVKINPRDVVSIPSDYNNAKGRTCRYEVVGEYTGDWQNGVTAFNDAPVVDEWDSEYDDYTPAPRASTVSQKETPLRDPITGRFVAKYSDRWYELKEEGF